VGGLSLLSLVFCLASPEGQSAPLPLRVTVPRTPPPPAEPTPPIQRASSLSERLASVTSSQPLGVWLTNSPSPLYYDRNRLQQAVKELKAAGFTTLYPNVWSRGTTFHQSQFAPLEPALTAAGVNLDPICTLSREAHARDMKVIPWFEYGLMEPAGSAVVRDQLDWVLQKANGSPITVLHGKEMVWLNPAHPQVRERFIGLVVEVMKRCRLDGLQLDDHFAWPVELGYDPYTSELYRQDTGSLPPKDDLAPPTTHRAPEGAP
jgi:uncharacterized lipoprotein YddW (UPF0748 family)